MFKLCFEQKVLFFFCWNTISKMFAPAELKFCIKKNVKKVCSRRVTQFFSKRGKGVLLLLPRGSLFASLDPFSNFIQTFNPFRNFS